MKFSLLSMVIVLGGYFFLLMYIFYRVFIYYLFSWSCSCSCRAAGTMLRVSIILNLSDLLWLLEVLSFILSIISCF